MIFIFLIIFLCLVLIVDFFTHIYKYVKLYSHSPLKISTFDGFNQPYHPSVLFNSNGWNNFKYWLVVTPYPMNGNPYKDRWECPCIYYSNDGINWEIASPYAYPLDDLNEEEIKNRDFFSDPHLIFKNNQMECWYRLTHRYENDMDTFILRKKSNDGIHWTDREILINPNDKDILISLGDMVRSPAIIWENNYKMWYVDNKKNIGQRNICYSSSIDGLKWEKHIICQLKGKVINPWHIDVSHIDNLYYLVIYDLDNLSLWESSDGIHFDFIKIILKPSLIYGSFWSDGLYRSALVKDNNNYLLYFSAYNEKKRCIGLMKGKSPTTLKIFSPPCNQREKQNWLDIYLVNRKRTLSRFKQSIIKFYS